MAREEERAYRKGFPLLTADDVAWTVTESRDAWHAARPAKRPYLGFDGPVDMRAKLDQLRTASDAQTARRRSELEATLDGLTKARWLTKYDDRGDVDAVGRLLGFPAPNYRYPEEMVNERCTYQDALQELWQRDLGNAIPAFALGAHLFPERAEVCIAAIKSFVMASVDFPTWGASEPYVNMDLSTDHLGRGIAIAYDWHPDIWDAAEKEKIFAVLRERVGTLLRGAYGDAFWARAWTENHCSNAFASLGIIGAAFLDEIPEAENWLAAAVVGTRNVVAFRNRDGSSDEGIPYWSYGMSFLLQYIELTKRITGAEKLYDAPHMKATGNYRLHSSTPDLSGALTFGDAPLHDYYGPAHILYALARRNRDEAMQWFGDAIPFPNGGGADIEAWTLLWRDPSVRAVRPPELANDYHFPDWDVAVSRSGWTADDYLLTVKSGPTNRNHTHLDAGCLLFAWGGQWLIEAPGYGKVGPGFWDAAHGRWTYYSNSTESHSTLLINDINQRTDNDARGVVTRFESTPDRCIVGVDLSDAYPGGHTIRRQVLHRRGAGSRCESGFILVLDEVEAASGSEPLSVEWLLQPGRTAKIGRSGPADSVANREIRLDGEHGGLRVRSLAGGTGFARRKPQSEHIDIPQGAIRTLALSADGASVAFAVLLTPEPAGAQSGAGGVEACIESWRPGARRVVVTGPGFSEVLF